MSNSRRIILALFGLLYISFCGCIRAETPNVPDSFTRESFFKVIAYARDNYLDPERINRDRAYVEAADAALRSLPYPLFLMTREFYENRAEYLEPERLIPGRALVIQQEDPYLIFVPDYKKWDTMTTKLDKKQAARRKKMSESERRAEFTEQRKKDQKVKEFVEASWNKIKFNRSNFENVIAWTEQNHRKYQTLPATYKGEDPYKDTPFGMHHVYFAATNGYLQAMDPHSAIIDESMWNKMRTEAEDSTFEGIGALLRGGGRQEVIVETPLPGSPALQAGLRAGDIIRKVDRIVIANLPLSDVVKKIRGPRETVVVLEVERPTELRTLPISIKRGVIVQTAVSSRLITDKVLDESVVKGRKVGVIKIASFLYAKKNTSRLIVDEYEDLLKKAGGKLDGLVVDLRGNPGGYLEEAVEVSDLFLPRGKVVVRVRGAGDSKEEKTRRRPLVQGVPIIVLINSGSASASEIVASALQDHNQALVVGERSFGKATVQGIHRLGSVYVKLTSARYYAPDGYTVQVHGVEPDVTLSDEVDGSFPPRFREEDMWKHLPELEGRKNDPARVAWVEQLQAIVGDGETAEKFIKGHKNDALKPDFMLIRAMAYFDALKAKPAP
ncbi:MAG: S41 family peptidase [bacterium]|nr:S41 family peptidase [bacterium]